MRTMVRAVMTVALVCCVTAGCPRPSNQDAGSSSGGVDAALPRDAAVGMDAAMGLDRPDTWDGASRCGTVTEDGECAGNVLSYCEVTTVITTDCAARGRVCAAQATLGGFWCVGGLGTVCDVNDTDVCEESVACIQGVCGGPIPDAGAMDAALPSDGGDADASTADASVEDGGMTDAAVDLDASAGD